MFDRVDYPYSETFVREAIQNSLDARLDPDEPVTIRFMFHEDKLAKGSRFLEKAVSYRETAGLGVPEEWYSDKIKWLTVEDSNTKGLLGDLGDRKGDFWGYWLNFGLSNKTGTGRGGRGIGRVTFLIASRMNTVLGITRRSTDHVVAACGMCVLKADQYDGEFKSTHSYLAANEHGSIYGLHSTQEFHSQFAEAFRVSPYTGEGALTGLSLVIPYPYEELDEDRILAAAIDHFAPAILNGLLVVEVGIDRLDQDSIAQVAPCVATRIKARPISEDVDRYLSLINAGLNGASHEIGLDAPNKDLVSTNRDHEDVVALRKIVLDGQAVSFRLTFPLRRNGTATRVGLTATVAPTPYGKSAIDRLFREGMSLPDVKTRRPVDLDLVLLVDEVPLAQYLNFCEGKAHLDLLESKEVSAKLEEAGFADGLRIKRLVKSLPDELRFLLTEESDEPDSSIFEGFFSIPEAEGDRKKARKHQQNEPEHSPGPDSSTVPPPNVSAVVVDTLADGFRLRANPDYQAFPVAVKASVAYADGSGKPSWSQFDFSPSDLRTTVENCTLEFTENRLHIENWNIESSVEVTGFDPRRELDSRIRTVSYASQD
jgi:hypothetical protein